MKDVIVELNGAHAVLLNGKGDFKIVKNRKYKRGQRLGKEDPAHRPGWVKTVASIAAAFVVMAGFGSALAFFAPYTYISLDINPSMELAMNYFNKVLEVRALNEDAERILEKIRFNDRDLESVLEQITTELQNQEYLKTLEQNELMLTAQSVDPHRAEAMLQQALTSLNRSMERAQVRANIRGNCIGLELRNRAREYGVTPGKLLLCERYAQAFGISDLDSLLCLSVRELMQNMTGAAERIQNENREHAGENGLGEQYGGPGRDHEGTELQERNENGSESAQEREQNRVREQNETGGSSFEQNGAGGQIGSSPGYEYSAGQNRP